MDILLQRSFVLEENLPGLANLNGFSTKLFWATIYRRINMAQKMNVVPNDLFMG